MCGGGGSDLLDPGWETGPLQPTAALAAVLDFSDVPHKARIDLSGATGYADAGPAGTDRIVLRPDDQSLAIISTSENDTLIGSNARERIIPSGDTIDARGGDDVLVQKYKQGYLGGRVDLGAGNDHIEAVFHLTPDIEPRRIDTGPGDDTAVLTGFFSIDMGPGDDAVDMLGIGAAAGGPGDDIVVGTSDAESVYDFLYLYGDDGDDVVTAPKRAQTNLLGGAGDDRLEVAPTGGDFRTEGGAGFDVLFGDVRDTGDDAFTLELAAPDEPFATVPYPGIERIDVLTAGDLIVRGSDTSEWIRALNRRATVWAQLGAGDDRIDTGARSDDIDGGLGHDRADTRGGRDYCRSVEDAIGCEVTSRRR